MTTFGWTNQIAQLQKNNYLYLHLPCSSQKLKFLKKDIKLNWNFQIVGLDGSNQNIHVPNSKQPHAFNFCQTFPAFLFGQLKQKPSGSCLEVVTNKSKTLSKIQVHVKVQHTALWLSIESRYFLEHRLTLSKDLIGATIVGTFCGD